MKKNNFDDVCKYLHDLENSSTINKEIISLSNKIENFCFKCNRENLNPTTCSASLNKTTSTDELKEINSFNSSQNLSVQKINYNPSVYLDHDILNKYLYLCDYLKNSSNKYKLDITKDAAIKLCLNLNLNYNESIDLLMKYGYILNPLSKRDSIIKYGIHNDLSIYEIDYFLFSLNEKPLL